jgi:hypothetical protein
MEHFGSFALLTTAAAVCLEMVRRRRSTRAELVALGAAMWGVGMGNEMIGYCFRWGSVFFNEDTVLDLTMNTLAILTVLVINSGQALQASEKLSQALCRSLNLSSAGKLRSGLGC